MSSKAPKSHIKMIVHVLREIFAITLWLYIFTKIFVYDIDLLLVNRFSLLQKIYPYKFFILVAIIAIFWVILGGKFVWKVVLYSLAYPFIILFWRIPKMLFKNWATVLIFLPAIESIFLTLKWRFALGSFALLAALGISFFMDLIAITTCLSILGLYLLVHYLSRFRIAYKPDSIFANIAPVIGKMWEGTVKTFKEDEATVQRSEDVESPEFQKKHIDNLKKLYLHNLIFTYFAKKLGQAVSSRRTDLYFIGALIYTFILTVIIFGFEYWGLFKINPSSFQVIGTPSFWAFLLYSFNTIVHTNFATMVPIGTSALVISNIEVIAALIIGLFFVFILLTSHRERHRQDVNSVVEQLSRSAGQMEWFIRRRLKMRLIDLEVKIIEVDPTFSGTLESFGRQPPIGLPGQPTSGPPTNTNSNASAELSKS
ncbi:MAG: hypothetical protein QOJ02_1867 [Acidobacteriota bacterium]|nr:hypothetical protein [Acidobacteriota bacterium]